MNYFLIEITDEQLITVSPRTIAVIKLYLRQLEIVSTTFFWRRDRTAYCHVIYGYGDERVIPLVADILTSLREDQPYFKGELVA